MDSSANVKSLASIEHFQKALTITQSDLIRLSEDTRIELDRVTEFLEGTAPVYWKKQYQRAQERWTEAREALSRCEQVTREDERRSCTSEKKQLEICKRRVELCENKLRSLKAFKLQWQQEQIKINTYLHQVLDMGETGIPSAVAELQQIIVALRKYAELEAGSGLTKPN